MVIAVELFDVSDEFQRRNDTQSLWLVLEGFSQLLAVFGVSVLAVAEEAVRYDVVVLEAGVRVGRVGVVYGFG